MTPEEKKNHLRMELARESKQLEQAEKMGWEELAAELRQRVKREKLKK